MLSGSNAAVRVGYRLRRLRGLRANEVTAGVKGRADGAAPMRVYWMSDAVVVPAPSNAMALILITIVFLIISTSPKVKCEFDQLSPISGKLKCEPHEMITMD
jgi:hypothetical protein